MINSRVGNWIIEEEIGRGGMGTVYKARRIAGEGPDCAAIKVLAAELAVEVGFQQRFQREIDILSQLEHPTIVRFYESAREGNRFWFAMEYVEGTSYEALRDERGRMSWPEVLDMAWQIAPALKHAHDRGVIHRDLKPSNLLRAVDLGPDGENVVKLTDFGISSLFASPHLTVTGGVIGTPEYLSPEQASGKQVTKKSDLYSLGCVLYALITGNTPFTGDTIELLHKHRYGQFDRPSRIVPDLPPDFDEIICQLLEKDPANRIPDGGVLFRRLDSLRRKLLRQTAERTDHLAEETQASDNEANGRMGPATFASQFVRQELEAQKQGGPINRFINHPFILVFLFALCLGALVWTFWPIGATGLYQRGSALMASNDLSDWERAWEQYFQPLEDRYPDHAYKEQLAEFKRRLEDGRAVQRAERAARSQGTISEARWFYERGLRQQREGDDEGARLTWKALIAAFDVVPAEQPWVHRARQALEAAVQPKVDRLASLREALLRARKLDAAGDAKGAIAIRTALRTLYAGDAVALRIVEAQ